MPEEEILIKLRDALEKRYRVRRTGRNGASFETTIPREALVREAKRLGVQADLIGEEFVAIWRYNDFKGLHVEIIKREADPKSPPMDRPENRHGATKP